MKKIPVAACVIATLVTSIPSCGGEGRAREDAAVGDASRSAVASARRAPAGDAEERKPGMDRGFLGDVEALTEGLSGDTAPIPPWPAAPAPGGWEPHSAPRVPLVAGLTIVTAIEVKNGDYESMKQVTAADDRGVTLEYSSRGLRDVGLEDVRTIRTVLRADLDSARTYRMVFGADDPVVFKGTTAVGISRIVLRDLDRSGRARLSVVAGGDKLGNLFAAFGGRDYLMPIEGAIERLEPGPVGLPVLVNGERKWLPALHAGGTLEGLISPVRVEFWFLADADNPLMLRAAFGSWRVQTVRIDLRSPDEASRLESALSEQEGPVALFGLYFAFGSAEILPESEPVLEQVAGLMRRHADWRLRVEGHTDDIGTAEANLELSRRRAQAVIDVLVGRLGGGAERLSAVGYGESRPIESNETLAGRARNRRVELIRF